MSKEERDARLDALNAATKTYAEKNRQRLNNQVAFAKRVLKGRTGSERLNNESVTQASALVVNEIDQFLEV
jgi:hypothetical protein